MSHLWHSPFLRQRAILRRLEIIAQPHSGLRKVHFFPTTFSTDYHIKIYIRCGEMLGGRSAWAARTCEGPHSFGGLVFLAQYLDVGSPPRAAPRLWSDTTPPQRISGASIQQPLAPRPNTMETLTKLKVMKVETEVRSIIAELDVALFFLGEANESSDKQRQRQLIRYAQIAHQAVLRLLPRLRRSGLDETRITIRLLQIRAGLKCHGISVAWMLQRPEMVVTPRKGSEKDPHPN